MAFTSISDMRRAHFRFGKEVSPRSRQMKLEVRLLCISHSMCVKHAIAIFYACF